MHFTASIIAECLSTRLMIMKCSHVCTYVQYIHHMLGRSVRLWTQSCLHVIVLEHKGTGKAKGQQPQTQVTVEHLAPPMQQPMLPLRVLFGLHVK